MSDYNRETDVRRELVKLNAKTLSFRDQCAIAALDQTMQRNPTSESATYDIWLKLIVNGAFNIADAMEAERKKRGSA